jgi:FAD/FMN-containing dehydrogenase
VDNLQEEKIAVSEEQVKSQTVKFDLTELESLRAALKGSALIPGDKGYEEASLTWDTKTFEQHPAIVVLPAVSADVVQAVKFANKYNLGVAVQAGGHGHPYPANDALFVNFANMHDVKINEKNATARVEPGARAGAVVQASQAHGLAPLNGLAGSVGVVGYMLSGGVGWLTRQYGSGAGSIRAAEIVTADGRLLQVDEHNNADLWWGLRGGGGNFGIVTALEFALYPVKAIYGGQLAYPIEQAKAVLTTYLEWVKTVPNEITSVVRLMQVPPSPAFPEALRGKPAVFVMAGYNGPAEEGEKLLKPIRSRGQPVLDTFAELPYSKVATISNDPESAPPVYRYGEGLALRDLEERELDTILEKVKNLASGIPIMELRHLGGALAAQPQDAMPLNFHKASFFLGLLAAAPKPEGLEAGKQSVAQLQQALAPHTTGETILGLAGNPSLELTKSAFTPANFQRLVALKDKYDPQNIFRFNHNIPPSSSEANS